ncbi:ribonuclease H-like protein [Piedraia hortae CBS 480.64]|uniref:Ribonuclease H-like protein n=1 Tax=Piedraia hortae CBS 480.64 TaxID=1314780 RepID=A0A6A7C923_9PEZI|nr:ribonuclease H-like protein [Piedraia hortae CBS 480.64]
MVTQLTAARLATLKLAQLKHAAFLLGLPSAGTKPVLQTAIGRKVDGVSSGPKRVLSVDMGIRNLAYCVLEHDGTASRVTAWQRLDLLKQHEEQSEDGRVSDHTALFTPAVLSLTAYGVTKELLAYKPDALLIERQRFRSNSGPAIAEWTVRVNMLESMLWACLQTLKSTGTGAAVDMHEVSPARVGDFWTAEAPLKPSERAVSRGQKGVLRWEEVAATKKRSKVTKNDRKDIVRAWMNGDGEVDIAFTGEAKETALSFGKKRSGAKLDDLADCLLQAAAWVRWEDNARRMKKLLM